MNYSAITIVLGAALLVSSTFSTFSNDSKLSTVQVAGPDLTERVEAAVETRLVAPLRKKDNGRESRMFSRCPSGYDKHFNRTDYVSGKQQILPEEDGYFYGEVEYYSGCDGEKTCEFRVDGESLSVEARYDLSDEFMPAKQWLAAHDSEKGDNM